ncbi:hypothetical protein E2320_013047, partial [Naja naja]
MEWDCLGSD